MARRARLHAAEVGTAIARLTEVGELDDRRFATRLAEDKRELSGWGPERIREVLSARGIARELSTPPWDGRARRDQLARAEGCWPAAEGRPPSDDAERAQALAFLTRRGYDLELSYEAIRRSGREAA